MNPVHGSRFAQSFDKTPRVGFRPYTLDQLPLIGRVPGFENLYIASG